MKLNLKSAFTDSVIKFTKESEKNNLIPVNHFMIDLRPLLVKMHLDDFMAKKKNKKNNNCIVFQTP